MNLRPVLGGVKDRRYDADADPPVAAVRLRLDGGRVVDPLESPEVGPRHMIAEGLYVRGEAAGHRTAGSVDVEGDAAGWLSGEQR